VDLASVINDHGAAEINSSSSSERVDQNTTRGGQEEMIRPGKEYKSLISEAAIPWLSDSSRCEDLSAVDGSALTEMLVDKIIIERYPSKIDKDGRRHYFIRAIPYQDPQQDVERLKAVHDGRVEIVPRV